MMDDVEARLNSHEAVCAERYLGIFARLKRLEQVLLISVGFIITTLVALLAKLH